MTDQQKQKKRAPRNRTITLTASEQQLYRARLLRLQGPVPLQTIVNRTICQDIFEILDWLPANSVDLLFADPPYNLTKTFNERAFTEKSLSGYEQ